MKIASYFDYYDWSLDKQLKLFNNNGLDQFIVRKINGKSFLDYQDNLKKYQFLLKKQKVGLFDPLLDPIDLSKEQDINNLKLATKFCRMIKCRNIAIKIKQFNKDVTTTELKEYFKQIIKITKSRNLIIRLSDENDMFIYNKIVNEIKLRKVKVIYNPVSIYHKNYSPQTAFRLFTKKMQICEIADTNDQMEAILVGYGEIDIKDIFKNLYEIRFKGLIALNSNLDEVFENFGINKLDVDKKDKKSNIRKYLDTIQKMGYVKYDSEEEVPFEDIIAHQIKLLKIVFK